MTNNLMLGGVYILMAIMLVLGSLMSRREPLAKLLTMALAWIAIFGAGFILFTFRDNFSWVASSPLPAMTTKRKCSLFISPKARNCALDCPLLIAASSNNQQQPTNNLRRSRRIAPV